MSREQGAVRAAACVSIAAVIACAWLNGCASGVSARVERNGVISMETIPTASPEILLREDMDGDGRDDFLLSRPGGVTVLLYNRTSPDEFSYFAVDIVLPTALGSVYAGNFDRDGFRELLFNTAAGLSVINDVAAPGPPPATSPLITIAVNPEPLSVVCHDFDADGDDDLAVLHDADAEDWPSKCSIYRNDTPIGENAEAGDFVLTVTIAAPPPVAFESYFRSVSVGRISDDATPDLLLCDAYGAYALAGNGDCTFDPIDAATGATMPGANATAGRLSIGTGPFTALLGDLDGDGDDDIVGLRAGTSQSVRLNNGNATFAPIQSFGGGLHSHQDTLLVDLDQNGTSDIVTLIDAGSATELSNLICVTKVNPDGTLQPTTAAPTVFRPTSSTVMQPTPNDPPSIVVSSKLGSRVVLHRNVNGTLAAFQRYFLDGTGGGRDAVIGDLTGDGYPDVYWSSMSSFNQVLVNRGDGSGMVDATPIAARNSSQSSPITFVPRPTGAGTVARAVDSTNLLVFSTITGDPPQFRFTILFDLPGDPQDIVTLDVNGDARQDAVVLMATATPGLMVSLQQPDGSFAAPTGYDFTDHVTWTTTAAPIASINNAEGSRGVLTAGASGAEVLVTSDNGLSFSAYPVAGPYGATPTGVAADDIDGDGLTDVIAAVPTSATTGVLKVSKQRTAQVGEFFPFEPTFDVTGLPGAPTDVAAADMDGDGDVDLVTTCDDGSASLHWTMVLYNDGGGNYDRADVHLAGQTPRKVVLGDLHNPAGGLRGDAATAGPEVLVVSAGPLSTNFEGIVILMNVADFAAPPPACPGDADGSGKGNFADITNVLTFWLSDYTPGTGMGDADHNGVVNFADVTEVLTFFGAPCP